MEPEIKSTIKFVLTIIFVIVATLGLGLWGCPQYSVYSSRLAGEAILAEAESSRQVKIKEARSIMESAKLLSAAEVTRARGAAEANHILQNSLGGPSGYLRYLQIQSYHELAQKDRAQVIYIPTESGLPMTEASRLTPVPVPAQ